MASAIGLVLNEQILLNCLLENNELILRLDKNYFVSQLAKDIFTAIKKCFLDGMETTTDNLIIFGNRLNNQITKDLLLNLISIDYNIDAFESHFKILKKDFAKHRIEQKILKDTLIATSSKGELDVEKIIDLQNEITECLEIIDGKESALFDIENMFDRYNIILNKRKKGDHLYETGDSYLDSNLTLGFAPGYMTAIIADSGVGKSIVGLNLINKQINKRIPCMYLSPENDLGLTMDRLISIRLDIDTKDLSFKNESINVDDMMERINEEKEKLLKYNTFYFVENPNISLNDISLYCKEAKKRAKSNYLAVTIDLLSMVKEFGTDIDPGNIEESMNKLHALSRVENVHFINILQANGLSTDFKPKDINDCLNFRFRNISSIKNSRAYGERCRAVLGAFRPKMIAENCFGQNNPKVEIMDDYLFLQIIKQNAGPLNTLKYLFVPEKSKLYKYKEE